MELTNEQRALIQQALTTAQEAQTTFWASLAALERALGVDVDGLDTRDLSEDDIDTIIDLADSDEEEE